MVYDLIIIGAGPAGLTAAIYATRKKLNALVLTKRIGGQVDHDVENYPGFFKVGSIEIVKRMSEQAEKYGALIREGVVITVIGKEDEKFLLRTGYTQSRT